MSIDSAQKSASNEFLGFKTRSVRSILACDILVRLRKNENFCLKNLDLTVVSQDILNRFSSDNYQHVQKFMLNICICVNLSKKAYNLSY